MGSCAMINGYKKSSVKSGYYWYWVVLMIGNCEGEFPMQKKTKENLWQKGLINIHTLL